MTCPYGWSSGHPGDCASAPASIRMPAPSAVGNHPPPLDTGSGLGLCALLVVYHADRFPLLRGGARMLRVAGSVRKLSAHR